MPQDPDSRVEQAVVCVVNRWESALPGLGRQHLHAKPVCADAGATEASQLGWLVGKASCLVLPEVILALGQHSAQSRVG